jgi:hypothetical protein
MFRLGTLAAIVLALAAIPVSAGATPPAPCHNAPQITDASGDGHHPGTDVLAAWWSEAAGRLQAVIQVRNGLWVAEHDDAELNGSGFALIYNGSSYLRVRAPAADRAGDPVLYDHGTFTAPATFTSAGATTGVTEPGPNGTVTIDVPPVAAPTRLSAPYVLTYDGINGATPTWVDHAPGGEQATDPSVGADYIVGSCTPAADTITAVEFSAPANVTGRRTVTVSGKVTPARAGIPVAITRAANGNAATTRTTTAADGTFSARLTVGETTRLRAVAETVGSRELTVTAKSKAFIKVKRRKDGAVVVTGTVDPKLPGRVLLLPRNGIKPAARANTRNGAFRIVLKHPKRGRYQAVVIPTGGRAERTTSNTGVIR